jgi:selenocysteine-specific elongation factor
VLHVGAAQVGTHARPLDGVHWRLTLDRPLPLRVGDRAVLRDPGSRAIWGVRVVDPLPPPLRRRGAAAERARALAGHDGSAAAELRLRGVVRRSVLLRLGAPVEPLPDGTVVAGDWLVAPDLAGLLRERLAGLVGDRGLAPAEAARLLDVPDPAVVLALVTAPLGMDGGRVVRVDVSGVPDDLVAATAALLAGLGDDDGFAAPEAGRLDELGLDPRALAVLHRAGLLLRVDDRVVLPPGADDRAVEVLRGLAQPFSASEARQALGTSRRVTLPLLNHLDRTGRTVRLPDDRRRLRGEP